MYSRKREDLGDGIIKAINNAKELASSLVEPSHSSSKSAHARALAEIGLEEIAKASLLFEKYVIAMMDGKATFDKTEHGFIVGSRTAHFKRVERIHHLYALSTQLTEWPGTSVMFTESIEDILTVIAN